MGKGLIENIRFSNMAVEGRIFRLFGFKSSGGQKFRDFKFTNLSCGSIGVGQIGEPGRNYFIGDAKDFSFDNFTFDGRVVT